MSATMTKLDRKTWATKLRDYMLAKATKKEADAASHGADSTIRAIRGELRKAMGDSPVAICGQAVLTFKFNLAGGGDDHPLHGRKDRLGQGDGDPHWQREHPRRTRRVAVRRQGWFGRCRDFRHAIARNK